MKFYFTLALALGISFSSTSQNSSSENPVPGKRRCGSEAPSPQWDAWFNKKVEEYKARMPEGKTQNISVTIPVIVHVIHPGSAVNVFPNISSTQIRSQINVLNQDYAGQGYNSNQLSSTGFSVVGAANTHITFCLAQYDPSGNLLAEPGIDRLNYNAMGWPGPTSATTSAAFQALMNGVIKPASIWDPSSYFNIWVSDVHPATELLGFATFPAGTTLSGMGGNTGNGATDGIWVWGRAFGNVGTPSTLWAPYDKGRTAVHETGHWLGLRHIGGDGNGNISGDCSATDFCDDTPPQKGGNMSGEYGQNFGAPSYPLHAFVCGSQYGDMFMNFMDYTYDASCYMFTPDQNIRMQTAMQEGVFRNLLGASSATLCTGMPYADFVQDTIGCLNSGITPANISDEGTAASTYSWSVEPADNIVFTPSSTQKNPTIDFPQTGSYTLSMVITNSIGVTSQTLALRVEECTGLNEGTALARSVRIAPNPTNGKFRVDAGAFAGKELQLLVYNSLGEVVASRMLDSNDAASVELDLGNCAAGIYMVSLSSRNERVIKRLALTK